MKEDVVMRVIEKTIGFELCGLDTNGQWYDASGKPIEKSFKKL